MTVIDTRAPSRANQPGATRSSSIFALNGLGGRDLDLAHPRHPRPPAHLGAPGRALHPRRLDRGDHRPALASHVAPMAGRAPDDPAGAPHPGRRLSLADRIRRGDPRQLPGASSRACSLFGFSSSICDVAMNVAGAAVERVIGRTIMPLFHAAGASARSSEPASARLPRSTTCRSGSTWAAVSACRRGRRGHRDPLRSPPWRPTPTPARPSNTSDSATGCRSGSSRAPC